MAFRRYFGTVVIGGMLLGCQGILGIDLGTLRGDGGASGSSRSSSHAGGSTSNSDSHSTGGGGRAPVRSTTTTSGTTTTTGITTTTNSSAANSSAASTSSGPYTPFVVDSKYITSGVMGDATSVTMIPSAPTDPTNCNGDRSSPTARGNCHIVTYTGRAADADAGTASWAGVFWQYPANNWCLNGGTGYAIPVGATSVTFSAKGDKGGEKVAFGAGYGTDSVNSKTNVVLKTTWQSFRIDISGGTWQTICGGFAWTMDGADAANGAKFYVDDIVWR